MTLNSNAFAQGTVLKVAYSMLGVTSTVILAWVGLQMQKRKALTTSDYFVFLAFSCHVTMCALYIAISPYAKRGDGVVNGEILPYPNLKNEIEFMTKMVFAAPCMFFMTLWSIKFSLLFLYRRLLVGIAKLYTTIWWGIVVFCILTHVVNYVVYFRSCGSTISGFWKGGCYGEAAVHTQLRSLYYSFAADTSTNIMIMALPIHLTWRLRMPRSKKIAILLLFASGIVCIMFSVLRVAQVAANAAKPEATGQMLDPTWLAIWGMVECSIAVIIGCCPGFAILINAFRAKSTPYEYNSQGYMYRKHFDGNNSRTTADPIHLGKLQPENNQLHWADAHSSQEELTAKHEGIIVTQQLPWKDIGS